MQFFPAATALILAIAAPLPQPAQTPPPQAAAPAPASPQSAVNEALFAASRTGDVAGVTKALANGADVNAKARYGVTAVTFAAGNGQTEVVRLLLDRGADPNLQDTFYRARAVDMALSNGHTAAAMLLMERGSNGGGAALMSGITTKNLPLIKVALTAKDLTRGNVNSGITLAKRDGTPEIVALLTERLTTFPADTTPRVTVDPATLQTYAGPFRNEASGLTVTFAASGDALSATVTGQPTLSLVPTSQTSFRAADIDGITFTFSGRGGLIEQALVTQGAQTTVLLRVPAGAPAAAAPAAAPAASAEPARPIVRGEARPWPAFRGANAAGNGDGQGAVTEWNAATQTNVKWKTPIPGIANSSPVVWGDRVFVTTAISSAKDATFRTGLYGDVKPVDDVSEHTWKMYCLDKGTGKIVWERIAHTGVPKVKRHTKSSQASSTPVTDGKHVVAVFGSVGVLEAWDINGQQLWKKDIGILDNGWFFDPEFQWGHSSSPIIYGNTVIVQADIQKNSFIAAYDLDSGKEVWRTERDEISTWGTPTIFQSAGKSELVTNGTKIRGYDPATGKLLWTLGPNSEVTVGTPIVGDGLVYVTAGYPPVRPVYAVKPGSSGDITLPKDKTSSDAVAWSNDKEGTYIPTPIFYEGLLYTLGNNGVLTVYDGKSGERLYRARVGGGGSFSASPVAADGRLFFPNEDGDIVVVRAGRTYQEIAKNEMKEVVMATPAISDGLIVIRTLGHVYGIGK